MMSNFLVNIHSHFSDRSNFQPHSKKLPFAVDTGEFRVSWLPKNESCIISPLRRCCEKQNEITEKLEDGKKDSKHHPLGIPQPM